MKEEWFLNLSPFGICPFPSSFSSFTSPDQWIMMPLHNQEDHDYAS